ncbi:YfhO family protein [Lacticaseibacillus rhamnosus]|uniref:YfhO family protein n=1 Tax=Lacticaseibacillus rhamnosus TaxID=47715 RepID=UPI0023E32127|nr:YfhO family protein [Lacticaseibacillus rhamnosus]MDF3334223.1 YfhO family protein [Lacticaseibacillus rhamnosus]
MRQVWSKKYPLILSFLLPGLLVAFYFAIRGAFPFGSSSVLTVDLGQQYIDFFAYLRQTLLGNPGQLFYAFNKGLGGDMFGVFAYYLLSPFNLLVVLFPADLLDVAVFVIMILKISTAGLTMGWYAKRHAITGLMIPTFGLAYALSGWMLANSFNLMWLDAAILLPLIIQSLETLLNGGRVFAYIGWLTAAFIVNFYTGYMIAIFLVLYTGYWLGSHAVSWRQTAHAGLRFAWASILAGMNSAVVLLPTWFQLAQSKGTYTVKTIQWRFEYAPDRLLSKMLPGSFNFDQMPSGYPNFYIGALGFVLAILFFISRHQTWRQKMAAALVTAFLVLSCMFEPLDLMWHGFQFPVWYPYRFTFILCFWLLSLGISTLQKHQSALSFRTLVILLIVFGLIDGDVALHLNHYNFLTIGHLIFGIGTLLLVLVWLSLDHRRPFWFGFAIVLVDMSGSLILTLNQLAYLDHHAYHDYAAALIQGARTINQTDNGFFRIGKTTIRTRNDPMTGNYRGADQFNSLLEPATPQFFGQIGQPEDDGSVAYTNGTLITDSLLGIKYFLTPTHSSAALPDAGQRPDLKWYQQLRQVGPWQVLKSPFAQQLGFAANKALLNQQLYSDTPLANQSFILQAALGKNTTPYFTALPLPSPTLTGVRRVTTGTNPTFAKSGSGPHTVTYQFQPQTGKSYVLTLGSHFANHLVTLKQNGKTVTLPESFNDTITVNVTPANTAEIQTLTFQLNKKEAWFENIGLYQADTEQMIQDLKQLQTGGWHVTRVTATTLAANITIHKQNQMLQTTIPAAPGWQVKVNGQPVKPKTSLGIFMAIPLKLGHYHITMRYRPPLLGLGSLITIAGVLLTFCWRLVTSRKKRTGIIEAKRRTIIGK